MPAQTKDFNQIFEHLSDSFAKTMKTGANIQQESTKFWSNLLDQNLDAFRKRVEKVTDETVPFSKANLERCQHLFDQQSKECLDMLREAAEVGGCDNPMAFYEKMSDLWKSSFETLRSSNESFIKAHNQMYESWSKLVGQMWSDSNGKPGPRPAAK